MTKKVSSSKTPRKQHSPEFRIKAKRISVVDAARELHLHESQHYNVRSKQHSKISRRYFERDIVYFRCY